MKCWVDLPGPGYWVYFPQDLKRANCNVEPVYEIPPAEKDLWLRATPSVLDEALVPTSDAGLAASAVVE